MQVVYNHRTGMVEWNSGMWNVECEKSLLWQFSKKVTIDVLLLTRRLSLHLVQDAPQVGHAVQFRATFMPLICSSLEEKPRLALILQGPYGLTGVILSSMEMVTIHPVGHSIPPPFQSSEVQP